MLSIDPEREAAGRTVAAMLVAKEIRQGGPIHLETILTEIGALEAARQQTVQTYQDAAARAAAQANKDRGEREVLAQFKAAAREVRRLIDDAARKLKAENPSDPDAREAEQAKAAMEKEIKELSDTIQAQRDGGTTDVFVGALAGVAAADAASPAVDILT
jgi:flagellar basal body rod protein FlgC